MSCPHCHSSHTIKSGKTPSGYQRYKCKDCHRTFSDNPVGPPTIGDRPMTAAEKQRKYRKRKKLSDQG